MSAKNTPLQKVVYWVMVYVVSDDMTREQAIEQVRKELPAAEKWSDDDINTELDSIVSPGRPVSPDTVYG
jgi:hypothetical protein